MQGPIHAWKLPLSFDAPSLGADLEALESDSWASHFDPLHHDGDWDVVALRSPGGRVNAIRAERVPYKNTPLMDEVPYIKECMGQFDCRMRRVRLMRLRAGAIINRHVDPNLSLDHRSIRLHIPISTNDQVEFYVGGERFPMAAGECWYIDATYPHEVYNKGPTDRVHLVFDCKINDTLRSYFPPAYLNPSKMRFLAYRYRWYKYRISSLTKIALQDAAYFKLRMMDKLLGRPRSERPGLAGQNIPD